MNEFLQQNLKEACGVNVDFDVVEWQVLLTAARATPDSPEPARRHGAQCLFAVVGCRRHGALFLIRQFRAERLQFRAVEGRRIRRRAEDDAEATDPKAISAAYRKAHERLVDNPPWLYIVHDLNPRAMSPKVKGFVSPQSWFVDLTLVSVQ